MTPGLQPMDEAGGLGASCPDDSLWAERFVAHGLPVIATGNILSSLIDYAMSRDGITVVMASRYSFDRPFRLARSVVFIS